VAEVAAPIESTRASDGVRIRASARVEPAVVQQEPPQAGIVGR
jgi:hypothetical protein